MICLEGESLVSLSSLPEYLNTGSVLLGGLWPSILSPEVLSQRFFIEQLLVEPEALLSLALYYHQTGCKDVALEVMPGYLR